VREPAFLLTSGFKAKPMPNVQSRKTMNLQENIEQICDEWKLNVVKVVNRDRTASR
jgi:hypothetical protein